MYEQKNSTSVKELPLKNWLDTPDSCIYILFWILITLSTPYCSSLTFKQWEPFHGCSISVNIDQFAKDMVWQKLIGSNNGGEKDRRVLYSLLRIISYEGFPYAFDIFVTSPRMVGKCCLVMLDWISIRRRCVYIILTEAVVHLISLLQMLLLLSCWISPKSF